MLRDGLRPRQDTERQDFANCGEKSQISKPYGLQLHRVVFFLPIVVSLFYLLPQKARWLMLLAASCVSYMWFVPKYILILLVTIKHRLFRWHLD